MLMRMHNKRPEPYDTIIFLLTIRSVIVNTYVLCT